MRLSLVNLMSENKNKSYGGLALDICDNPEKIKEIPPETLEVFEAEDWSTILCVQTQLLPYFEKHFAWNKMTGMAWADLLCEQPQFSANLDELIHWKKLNEDDYSSSGAGWSLLLAFQPQSASRCNLHNAGVYLTI